MSLNPHGTHETRAHCARRGVPQLARAGPRDPPDLGPAIREKATGNLPQPRFTSEEVGAALGGPVSHLGSGTFSDTWKSGDTAVKILCGEPVEEERLQREIDGLNRVCSPNVVRLIGTGKVTLRGHEYNTLVFEYIEGGDVAERLARRDLPSAKEAEAFLHGLLTGVGQLHAKKTVHRDVKPANVVLRGGDWSQPVLIDLGLARAADEATITANGVLVGTIGYMAPEVLLGQGQRPASDLFAVGVTVREVLSGQHPFYDGTEKTFADMIRKVSQGARPLPGGVPAHVRVLLDRLTHSRRWPRGSADSCLQALDGKGAAA